MLASLFLMALAVPLSPQIIDHAALDQAIETFTGHPVGTPGGAMSPVDRRLRLAACKDARLSWRTAHHDTLVMDCATGPGWRLFVPIAQVRAASVAAAPALAAAPEAAPLVVAKGDVVTVEIRGNGFSVSQDGQAIEPGTIGSWIKVKMTGKGEILTAQVVRRGLLSIPSA